MTPIIHYLLSVDSEFIFLNRRVAATAGLVLDQASFLRIQGECKIVNAPSGPFSMESTILIDRPVVLHAMREE